MTKPIINISDIELRPTPPAFAPTGETAQRFEARMGLVAPLIGAQKLGYNVTAVPPGKRAFPFHNHRVNEEMFFILEGSGEVRIGDAVYPVKEGDIIACPPGGEETAHQIINTGEAEMRYLAISTKLSPEIADYPDSEKFAVLAELTTDPGKPPQMFRFVGREGASIDYWEGE